MKVFITGATGFIGQNLLQHLRGNNFYLYSRGEDVSEALIKFQPDYVYHLAADIYDDTEMFNSNIKLTYDILDTLKSLPIKGMVYVGSSSEYGRKNHPMKETDYLDPVTMYEATKGAASLLCQAYARTYNVPVVIARPFSVYGPHEAPHRFIPTLIRSYKLAEPIKVSPGVHDFIHVDDFCEGLRLVCENAFALKGEIYNFGTGSMYANEEVVQIIERMTKYTFDKEVVGKMRPFDTDMWVCDNSKARSIGWKVTKTLPEGLAELLSL